MRVSAPLVVNLGRHFDVPREHWAALAQRIEQLLSAHLFISVLAYHLVHTIRYQLKACGINLSWEGLRRQLAGQDRVTIQLKRADGRTLHIRKTTRAESRQQSIDDALGRSDRPGKTEKTII